MTGLYHHKMCHKKCFNQVLRDILWRSFRYYVTPKLDNIWHKKSLAAVNNMWQIIWRQTRVTKTILNRARTGRQQHSVTLWLNTMWHKLAHKKEQYMTTVYTVTKGTTFCDGPPYFRHAVHLATVVIWRPLWRWHFVITYFLWPTL